MSEKKVTDQRLMNAYATLIHHVLLIGGDADGGYQMTGTEITIDGTPVGDWEIVITRKRKP